MGRITLTRFGRFFRGDEGATAIEYGMIAAFVVLAIVGAVLGLGGNLSNAYQKVANMF